MFCHLASKILESEGGIPPVLDCGYQGGSSGEGLGEDSHKGHTTEISFSPPLPTCQSHQPNLAALTTDINFFVRSLFGALLLPASQIAAGNKAPMFRFLPFPPARTISELFQSTRTRKLNTQGTGFRGSSPQYFSVSQVVLTSDADVALQRRSQSGSKKGWYPCQEENIFAELPAAIAITAIHLLQQALQDPYPPPTCPFLVLPTPESWGRVEVLASSNS
jgi:hypothetical protein